MNKLHIILIPIVLFLSGCGSMSDMESFLREDVDISYVNTIAVVPFENNTKDTYVAERVRDIAITQILSYRIFDVVDKGLVDSSLREEAVDLSKAPMDGALMKRLGQRLNVQAFLLGTVDQAERVQRGNVSFSQLSLTLRLVDIHTGMIFWQSSGFETGDSLSKRLFGLSSDDDFNVALKLIRELLNTLPDTSNSNDAVQFDNNDQYNLKEGDNNTEIIIMPQEQDQW